MGVAPTMSRMNLSRFKRDPPRRKRRNLDPITSQAEKNGDQSQNRKRSLRRRKRILQIRKKKNPKRNGKVVAILRRSNYLRIWQILLAGM